MAMCPVQCAKRVIAMVMLQRPVGRARRGTPLWAL